MIFTRRGGPQITVAGPHTPFTGGGPGGPGGSDGGMFLVLCDGCCEEEEEGDDKR